MFKRVVLSAFIFSSLGIIFGLFYSEFQTRKLDEQMTQQMIQELKEEIMSLQKTNDHLIKELIQVQVITGTYDSDARFIESVEGYQGLLSERN